MTKEELERAIHFEIDENTVVVTYHPVTLENNTVEEQFLNLLKVLDRNPKIRMIFTSPEMAGRTEREIYQRITALGSMCMSVCYTSVLEGKPDNIDNMKPILYDIIRRAL